MNLNCFDRIIYINLDHRKDRSAAFLKEMKRIGVASEKLQRLPGIYDGLNGARGCVQSHIQALTLAEEESATLILEDDCVFTEDLTVLDEQVAQFFQTFENKWDVYFLGGKYVEVAPTPHEAFQRVLKSFRAHAYAVRGAYACILKSCFQKAYAAMEGDLFFMNSRGRALDYAWEELQKKDRWYAGKIPLAFQSDSYSDVELFHRSFR